MTKFPVFSKFNNQQINENNAWKIHNNLKILTLAFMNGNRRNEIKSGLEVMIVLKKDQRTGNLTEGIVKDILTSSSFHPHGIKVRLQNGMIGRVKEILSEE